MCETGKPAAETIFCGCVLIFKGLQNKSNTVGSCPRGLTNGAKQQTNPGQTIEAFFPCFEHVLIPSNKGVPLNCSLRQAHICASGFQHSKRSYFGVLKRVPQNGNVQWKLIIHYQIFSRPPICQQTTSVISDNPLIINPSQWTNRSRMD